MPGTYSLLYPQGLEPDATRDAVLERCGDTAIYRVTSPLPLETIMGQLVREERRTYQVHDSLLALYVLVDVGLGCARQGVWFCSNFTHEVVHNNIAWSPRCSHIQCLALITNYLHANLTPDAHRVVLEI